MLSQLNLRSAFTLIEILIVIAIITLLATILFPAFSQTREQVRKTTCLSNLRQIGTAFQLYLADCDAAYPNTGNSYFYTAQHWRWPLIPDLSAGQHQIAQGFTSTNRNPSILLCPSDTASSSAFDATSYLYPACYYHTANQINGMHFGDLLSHPSRLTTVTQIEVAVAFTANKVLVTEWLNSHHPGPAGRIGFWGSTFYRPVR